MRTHYKKPIKIINRTKYFDPDTVRSHVTFGSPDTYQSRRIKIEGYESRLYWQYKYCDDHDGQTYFYTLTYNDAHMPQHYGMNCFDYEDLRQLLCGGFRKKLLRKYGTYFKYFVGAELGDGKGTRGMHNNPHYHILFFLENANDPRFPYVKIIPEDFRNLVKMYWQGFDETRDGFHDYQDARFGIAREGENCGLVTDFRACMYCAKYVCKDVKLKQNEDNVTRFLRLSIGKRFKQSEGSYEKFFKTKIYELYNIPLNPHRTEWAYSAKEMVEKLLPDVIVMPMDIFGDSDNITFSFTPYVPGILSRYNLWSEYYKFCDAEIDILVHEGLTEYRNRYCNKCRISQGLGDYALSHIEDKMNPYVQVPSKKGFKNRPIGMYYYRKLYTDLVHDSKGHQLRVLNDLGIQYKLTKLPEQIQKKINTASSQLSVALINEDLFETIRNSDINTDVLFHFSDFVRAINKLKETDNIKIILQRYAEYKLVYEDRFFKIDSFRAGDDSYFPNINLYDDYRRFLTPVYLSVRRSDYKLSLFLEDHCPGYLPYSAHPYFLRYLSIFSVLDMLADYFFIQVDDQGQKQAEEIAEVSRFHNKLKVQEFYKRFS